MEDIIQEIAKIDSRVYATKNQSQERIEARRKYYEEQMAIYEKARLKEATEKGEEIYKNIMIAAEQQSKFEEEKAKQISLLIENRYLQVEEKLLTDLFSMLFAVEA